MTSGFNRTLTSSQRGYGSRWQRYRKTFLQEFPLCMFCEEQGKTVAAKVVDHIIPHKGDSNLFWDKDNHQSLCTTCHQSTKQLMENNHDKPVINTEGWPE